MFFVADSVQIKQHPLGVETGGSRLPLFYTLLYLMQQAVDVFHGTRTLCERKRIGIRFYLQKHVYDDSKLHMCD